MPFTVLEIPFLNLLYRLPKEVSAAFESTCYILLLLLLLLLLFAAAAAAPPLSNILIIHLLFY